MNPVLTTTALITALALIGSVKPAPAAQTSYVCIVADPTDTPLNVRAQPNSKSKILGALANDTKVVSTARDGKWSYVLPLDSVTGKKGWVFGEYLDCTM